MAKIQLEKMTLRELLDLQTQIGHAIVEKKAEERDEVKRKIAELAGGSGFDVSELFATRRATRKGSKVAIKYANPKNPQETWTGRGRKPRWLVAKLAAGQKIESFLVS